MLLSFLYPLMASVFFASDCDKTLVFYDTDLQQDPDVISLPPSSGSGKIAYVSKMTLSLLEDVSDQCDGMICVSGMRSETMLQRYHLFPHIQFWITENGGRMFKRSSTTPTILDEYEPYTDYVDSLLSGSQILDELATSLASGRELWKVDTYDYKTMIRIKQGEDNAETLASLESRISKELFSCTYNLGYLDIQIKGLGKYNSVKWLTQHLVESVSDEKEEEEITVLFMGDDDNDIEISTQVTRAFIANPCSANMLATIVSGNDKMEQAMAMSYASAEENLRKVLKFIQHST